MYGIRALARMSPLSEASTQKLSQGAPGLAMFKKFFSTWLKLDLATVAVFVTIVGAFSGGLQHLEGARSQFYNWVIRFFTTSVSISGSDRLNREILNWLGANVLTRQNPRKLTAQSRAVDSTAHGFMSRDDRGGEEKIHYLPTFGTTWLFHEHRLFMIQRDPDATNMKNVDKADRYAVTPSGKEPLLIMCFDRSIEPIKRFLDSCRQFAFEQNRSCVTIYASKFFSGWDSAILRPHRPLETVHFDQSIRDDLIADIEKYLRPETRAFYTERGVPYRRGYLLHGPPGTGKTSLTFALAGHFKLNLWIVNLPSLGGDDALEYLFMDIPQKCIVLIEDIDAVGLKREKQPKPESGKHRQQQCTLSGLLNVLDGISAQQGRVLLMTTNIANNLDDALVRPGRVDKKIYLGNLSQESARLLFLGMYHPRSRNKNPASIELQKLAVEFSAQLPAEEIFSPAQVQGHLLDYPSAPETAKAQIEARKKREQEARRKESEEAQKGASKTTKDEKSQDKDSEDEKSNNKSKTGEKTETSQTDSTPKVDEVSEAAKVKDSDGTGSHNGVNSAQDGSGKSADKKVKTTSGGNSGTLSINSDENSPSEWTRVSSNSSQEENGDAEMVEDNFEDASADSSPN
ncbi:P-loop containing nucleoside triphosphate hydrolase protein [Xylariales sp. AK1849]|nr:P-loop containing nucleoside triphosphate hydrolase protein [Xylariales sp. AK1849]